MAGKEELDSSRPNVERIPIVLLGRDEVRTTPSRNSCGCGARLDRKPVGEQHMMAELVQPAGRQLQSGRAPVAWPSLKNVQHPLSVEKSGLIGKP
jgi:hypothetical protein